ncbi:MAG: hypothetical protein IJM30_02305 [Thermoguttaceae bacterium]|nr:hypothetical protein [Thermoguttaceae bacterium]
MNARFTVGNSSTYITVIPFKRVSISTARSLFINTIPGLDVSVDYASDSLIVYGSKSGVEAAIQLASRLENSLDITLEILPLTKELPLEVVSALPRIEPNCVATYDRANSRLMIYGKPTDVARLKAYVSQIQESTTDEVDGVFYLDVERDVPGEIQDYAKRAVPGVELTYNRDSRRFTIIGTPTEQLATAKILTDAITNLPPEDETRYYRFDERIPSRLIELLNERVKGVNKIERDEFDKQALRVVAKPYQHELIAAEIEKIKTNYPFADQKEFVSYKTTKEVRASFEQVKNDFQSQYGEIKILQDNTRNSFAVWATPPQHEALKKLLDELASVESGDKESAQLYAPKYVDATTLVSVLRDLQPNLTITNDATNGRIIMRGTATELAEAKEALSMLDVRDENGIVRTFKSYPVKGFYSYDGVGSYYTPAYYVRDLSKLVPAARVTYDYYNQAIIVWGTEEEQAIVEQAVSNLAEKDQLDKRVLRWPIRRANYSTLSTQITAVYPGATPVYDSGSKTLIVRTTNGVALDAVKELLELLDPEQVSEFDPVLQYYDVGTAPSDDLVAAVQALVPNAAMVKIDAKNKQLLVIGTAVEQKTVADNVEKLAQTYGSSDLRMIPYPVYGMAVADLVASLTKAYPTAQVDADERGGRVLVRATLEDHVKISEEIARINSESGEATENPNDPDAVQNAPGPRVVVYEANTQMIATQLRGIVTSMFPGVEVFGGQGGYGGGYGGSGGVKPKVTILANGREQKMIASILESLNKTGDDLQFAVYPYGSAEAGAVEAIVGNLVPNAMSIPAMTKVDALRYYGPGGLSQRFRPAQQQRAQRQYGGFGADPNAPIPFYRIDEASRTVAILASPEAHEKIREAIEKLSSLSTNEARSTTKVYRLGPPIAPAIVQFVPQILPSLVPQMVTTREFIAYGPAKDLEELDKFIGELSDKDFDRGIGRMRLFRVPAESKYNRDRIVTIINANFASLGISAYPGALPDQIITWGLEIELSKVEQMLDELFKQPNETTYKTYHISRTTLPSVIALLQQVVPNLEIVPNYQQRSLIVKGTEEDHARCKEAIDAFDKAPNDESALSLARYNWDDVASYWTIYSELQTQFAQTGAIIASASDTYSFVVTATEALQEDIATYIKRRRENLAEQTVQLRSYYLTNVNFTKVVQIVVPLLPRVGVYPGKGANEIFVIASPLDHDKFKMMLSTLETVPEGKEANGIEPKIYECSGQAAATAVAIIQPQLPGTVMYPLSGDRLIVWGSVSDHEYVSKALDTIGEAFPNNVLKRYPLIHIRFADALMYCQYRFPPSQAVFFSSTSGDLMVVAGPPVQEQVAEMLAEIDVENSEETTYVPVAYDISDIPVASHPYVSQAIAQICYDCVQLPTSTPGFLVIYARPNEHKKVKKVIDEMLKDRPSGTRHMEAYSVRRMTLAQLSALILPLYPNVQIGAGTSANQVVILAKNEEHARIRELVDQLNEETDDGTSSRVYRLKNSQLAVARAAILEMFPHSTVVIDQMSRSVLVKAYADEQKKIEELVAEIDEKDPERNTSFKVFNIGSVNFTRLVAALRNFYSGDPAFQVQLDSTSQCLIVRGTAIQHKAVEDLIEEVRAGGLADPEAYMQAYAVKSASSMTSLYEIFWEQGRELNMFRDYYTGKLIVIGRPEDHKAVQDVLDLVAPEETELAVFDLLYVDPSTARQVFSMIETDGTYVDVRLDSSTNQLFIRATPAKLEEIRQVLIKMGEKELTKMKPFAETSQGGASATDGRRIYLRDNEKRQEEYQKSQGLDLIDPTRLEPIDPAPLAAATPAGPSLKVQEGTGPMRSVTVLGGDANQAVQQALKNWNLDNPVTVVKSDGGIVQEKGASDVPAVEAPKVEPAPEAPKAEAPKAEEPKAEEPKTEEPKAEEPKAESSSVVPVTENATASAGLAPFFLRGSRSLLTTLCFGALVVDSPAAVDEAAVAASTENAPKPVEEEPKVDAPTEETNPESVAQEAESAPAPETTEGKKIELSQAPGVYVVVNPDGSLLLSSSDEKALEAFQKKLSEAVDEMKAEGAETNANDLDVVLKGDEPSMSNSEPTAKSEVATETEEAEKETEDEDAPFDPNSYLSYMTPENIAKAKERIIMESRNYTVYKVENVGVSQIVPRLQTYLQDRINRGTSDPYSYYSSSGINMRTIGTSTRLTFQPDAAYNTLMVYGTKADREIVGAMLVVLDDAGLFPQPITKPYKIKVENTSPSRMAQQVLQAFSRKFQTTLMPGNLTPRIMPNNTTSSLEVYAPESLAKEIEEYVKEVDAEILEESVRKVRVVELKSMNSKILTQYMQNLMRQRVAQQMLSTPYIGATSPMMNPMMGANAAALNAAAARRRNMMLQGGYGGGFPPGAIGPGGVVPGAGVAR